MADQSIKIALVLALNSAEKDSRLYAERPLIREIVEKLQDPKTVIPSPTYEQTKKFIEIMTHGMPMLVINPELNQLYERCLDKIASPNPRSR